MCRVHSCLMSVELEQLLGDFCVKHLIFRGISRHIFLVARNIRQILRIYLG